MSERYIHFIAPPLPHYLIIGDDRKVPGDRHADRNALGVFDLIVVAEGDMYLGEGTRSWKVSAGQALILLPNAHHYSTRGCDRNTRYYWLHFQTSGEWRVTDHPAAHEAKREGFESDTHFQHYGNTYQIAIKQYSTLSSPTLVYQELEKLIPMRASAHTGNCLQQQAAFHNILYLLHEEIRASGQAGAHVAEQAAHYIRNHYKRNISLKELHNELHFHPVYITRCMKRTYGCTPLEYANRYRIETAKLHLMTTDKPISVIAGEVGFDNVTYFSRCFRKYANTSPRSYRSQFRT